LRPLKKLVVVDILDMSSAVNIFFLFLFGKVERLIYCRQTKVTELILVTLLFFFRKQVSQSSIILSEVLSGGLSLAVKRDNLLQELMKNVLISDIFNDNNTLNIDCKKLKESWRIKSWKLFFYQSEALVLAEYLGGKSLIRVYLGSNHPRWLAAQKYRVFLPQSPIIERKRFVFDTAYTLPNSIRVISRHLTYVIFAIYHVVRQLLTVSHHPEKKYSICVHSGNAFQSLKHKSDFFWIKNLDMLENTVAITGSKVSLQDNLNVVPVFTTSCSRKVLEKHPSVLSYRDCAKLYLSHTASMFQLLCISLFNGEVRIFLDDLLMGILYSSFLEASGSKVFTSMTSYFNGAGIVGANMAGVCYVRGGWSNERGPSMLDMTSADVFFTWGMQMINHRHRSGSSGICYVHTGFIDGELSEYNALHNSIGTDLKDFASGGIVIAFFDNLIGDDFVVSRSALLDCFTLLFDLINSNSQVKVVFKPKDGDLGNLKNLGCLTEYKRLEKSGRIFTASGRRKIDYRPSEIGAVADLAIGFPLSTAATECAIVGCRAIHLNLTGVRDHPWDTELEGVVMFHDIANMRNAINDFLKGNNDSLGLCGTIDIDVNFYSDFKARERMSVYIRLLCEYNGNEIEDRIAYANRGFLASSLSNANSITLL